MTASYEFYMCKNNNNVVAVLKKKQQQHKRWGLSVAKRLAKVVDLRNGSTRIENWAPFCIFPMS